MKKIPLAILLSLCVQSVLNASSILPDKGSTPPTTKEVMIPLAGTGKFISLEDYLTLTPKSYKEITGEKMSFGQKVDLSISKQFFKKTVRKNSAVDVEKMKRRGFFGGWHWHWGGFALGLFLSFLGPIVALFFNDEYKWDRFWSALHTAVWVGLIAVAILAVVTAGGGY